MSTKVIKQFAFAFLSILQKKLFELHQPYQPLKTIEGISPHCVFRNCQKKVLAQSDCKFGPRTYLAEYV